MKFLLVILFILPFTVFTQNTNIVDIYNQGDYTGVIHKSDQLIEANQATYETYYYRGLSQQALYQYNNAVKSFIKAQNINLDVNISLVLANAWELAGNDDKALEIYNVIIQNDSSSVLALAKKASILKSEKEYFKATDIYTHLVKLDSMNSYFYYQLAFCVSKIGLSEAAASYFLKAYALNTDDFNSVKGYLGELVKQKYYEDANAYIDSFLYAFPNNLYLLKQKAYLAAIGGNYLEAVKQFEKIVGLGDTTSFTCKYYGQSLYNNGNYDKAVIWLEKYLQSHSSDAKNQYIIGLAYQKDYQYQNSLDAFNVVEGIIYDKETIAQLFKERATTYIAFGDYYGFRDSTGVKKKQNYDLALESFLKAEELYPQNYTIYKDLGSFYDYKLHNAQLALYYYQIYYNKIDPEKINEYELMWIQDKLGKLKEEVHFLGE